MSDDQVVSMTIADDQLRSVALFEQMKPRINADLVKQANAVYVFNITKNGKVAKTWSYTPNR